jgi:hypothetical protein
VNAFLRFNKGVLRLPLRVQLYMAVLMALNALAPLYYWSHPEASVVLAAFMASFLLMVALTARVGFVRLLGMGHIFWVPMIVYLIGRMGEHTLESSVGIWIRLLIFADSIALVLDLIDIRRYVRGDRAEMVPDLDGSRSREL